MLVIIDMHVHPFCKQATVVPDLDTALERLVLPMRNANIRTRVSSLYRQAFCERDLSDIVREMDEAGVDKSVIVAMDLSSAYGTVLVTNDDVARMAQMHPGRFIPFASVDPTLGYRAVEELVRAVEVLGCKGLKLVPPVQNFEFSDPKLAPFWQTVNDLNLIVWTHAAHQVIFYGSDSRLGNPMLVEPLAMQYPDLRIVLGHCGFPWLWETWSMTVRHANVYVDISGYPDLYRHLPWDAYSKYFAEEKVLFATDYPIRGFKMCLEAVNALDISEEFKRKIVGENAARLLDPLESISPVTSPTP
jgi:hypothetical protein